MPTDKLSIFHKDHEEEEEAEDDDDAFRKAGQWLLFQEKRSGFTNLGTFEERSEAEEEDWRRDSIGVLAFGEASGAREEAYQKSGARDILCNFPSVQ